MPARPLPRSRSIALISTPKHEYAPQVENMTTKHAATTTPGRRAGIPPTSRLRARQHRCGGVDGVGLVRLEELVDLRPQGHRHERVLDRRGEPGERLDDRGP